MNFQRQSSRTEVLWFQGETPAIPISGFIFVLLLLVFPPTSPAAEPERWTVRGRTILVQAAAEPEANANPTKPAAASAIWFHLPGTGGRLYVDPPLPGIVQVGMPAIRAAELPAGSDLATATWQACLRVRERLVRDPDYAVDPTRCLVGGMSRGGWIATGIASKRPADLRGVLIFGAGLHPNSTVGQGPFPRGFSVYIGCGDLDANLPHAYAAVSAFRRAGATVSHERYVAEGHVRRVTPRLRRWLAGVVGGGSGLAAAQLDQINQEEDDWLRYRLLETGLADPAFAATDAALRQKWQQAFAAQKDHSEVTEGLARLASFRRLLRREIELSNNGKGTPELFRELQKSHTELAATMPGTPEFVESSVAASRLSGIVKRRTEELKRFDNHAAAKQLREIQAEMNATQARLKTNPNQADATRLRSLAVAYAAEAQRVQRAGNFARLQPAPEAELGPDPLPDEVKKLLGSRATAPAQLVFEETFDRQGLKAAVRHPLRSVRYLSSRSRALRAPHFEVTDEKIAAAFGNAD